MSDTISGSISSPENIGGTVLSDAYAPGAPVRTLAPRGPVGPPGTTEWEGIQNKPTTFPAATHASTHVTGGADPLTAAAIGAAPVSHTHLSADVTDATNDGNANPGKLLKSDDTDGSVTLRNVFLTGGLTSPFGSFSYGPTGVANTFIAREGGIQLQNGSMPGVDLFTGYLSVTDLAEDVTWTMQAGSGTVAFLSDIPDGSDYAPAAHTHPASAVTDFATAVATNSAVAANTAKTTNATHTGDVTGATELTIAAGAVTEAKCNASINASLALADTAVQPTAATKTTPIDADTVELQDSTASGARKLLTFANLWTWIKSIIDQGQTWAGAHSFSSTTRPTSAGTGAPAANSLITRDDADARLKAVVVDFDYAVASAGATGGDGVWSYILPDGARSLDIICVGGGSGGGSGRCGAADSNRSGGGGGAGGPLTMIQQIPVDLLPSSTLAVIVGLGGAGGASITTDDTNGADGGTGGNTTISSSGAVIAIAGGLSAFTVGKGGTPASGAAGGVGSSIATFGVTAGSAGQVGNAQPPSAQNSMTSGGSTGGGGVSSSGVIGRGAGGVPSRSAWGTPVSGSRATTNGDGLSGTDPAINPIYPTSHLATGGNGGILNLGGAGRSNVRGGGGGGGGAGTNGAGSGPGGKGGDGFVRLTIHF